MTVALSPFILRHPELKNNVEQFMLQHVLPEFSSGEPFMRTAVGLIFLLYRKSLLTFTCNKGMSSLSDRPKSWNFLVIRRGMPTKFIPYSIEANSC